MSPGFISVKSKLYVDSSSESDHEEPPLHDKYVTQRHLI